MKRLKSNPIIISLIVSLFLLVACSQTTETDETLTPEPTKIIASAEPEIREVVETVIIPSEVVVENFIIQKRDDVTDEIEIVVQGYFRNSCTAIDAVSISQEGDLLLVDIRTKVTEDEDCKEEETQFQEVVTQNIGGLEPGIYFISRSPVEKLSVQPVSTLEADGEVETTEDTTGAAETTPATPRECEDLATFLTDVTYPDNSVVTTGQVFTKTWEIRNDGDCTWGLGYSLKGVSGNFSEVVPVEDPFPIVEPSQTVQISLVLTAPQTPGEVSAGWVIQRPEGNNVQIQNGENFDLWAIVNVVEGSGAFRGEEDRVLSNGVVCAQAKVDYDNEVLDLINAVRAENDLPEYQVNDQLTSAAWILTSDMACNGFFDHVGSDGSSLEDRLTSEGYAFIDAAESIYYGFAGVPVRVFDWWMKNAVDSGNVLSSTFSEIGIAYALNPQTGASYYTIVFAVPEAEE